MENKICTRCKISKPITEYSFMNKAKGIMHSQCKECKSNYYIKWYAENGRSRKDTYADIIVLWQNKNKDKEQVKKKTAHAIKRGLLTKPLDCSICNRKSRLNAHHEDYNKPFEIIWVCSSCHKKIHLDLIRYCKDS